MTRLRPRHLAAASALALLLSAAPSRAETAFTVSRPATQAKDSALFIEVQSGDDLAPLALERGMIVVRPDLTQTSPALRAHELHEIVARLRVAYAAHRVIGHAAAANIAVLMGAANDFDGLLLSDSAQPVVASKKTPRIIETWGSDLYWKSPVRIDAQGAAPQNLRRFFIAGAVADIASSNCLAPLNPRSAAPALRALLVVLDDWTKGVAPPASRVADLTDAHALKWPTAPGLPPAPSVDHPVPRIDADGNETSGLRLPDQALPIASFTGFNAQKDSKGAPCNAGAMAPFASTKAVREKSGDTRLALIDRYGSRAYFVATMRVIADRLVKERLLLPRDADAYVAAAKTAPF